MDRYELVASIVNEKLHRICNQALKEHAFVHLHNVVVMGTMLAMQRNINIEYVRIAAILHDIAVYLENCPHSVHAYRSSIAAARLLEETHLFTRDEINCIVHMIAQHSNKDQIDDLLCETLKDADILASGCLSLHPKEALRFDQLIYHKK